MFKSPYSRFHKDEPIKARLRPVGSSRFRFAPHARQLRESEDRYEVTSAQTVTPAVEWIEENCIDPTTVNPVTWDFKRARRVVLEAAQKRILRRVLTPDPRTGVFPYSTIVWSQIKKSGKTTTAGCVGAWYAAQIEAPNVVLTVANDQEQSAGRIFAAMKPTFKLLGANVPTAPNAKPHVMLDNGTNVRAIANNYEGEAGENYGLTLWSELWAYKSERGRRLWDELMPVPTRKNSLRWVETYAGFEDESDLLLSLYMKVFTDTTEKELQPGARPVAGLEDIVTEGGGEEGMRPACYEVPEEGLFVFWDRSRRMPWQLGEHGERYYQQQKASLRPSAYTRLCENRWQKHVSAFIPEDWYARSVQLPGTVVAPMVVAIDASQRHNTTAVVGVRKVGEFYETVFVEVFDPRGQNIDLELTAAATVERLFRQGLIETWYEDDGTRHVELWYDPAQMHQVAMNLQKKGIPCQEFAQGVLRTKADTLLYQVYRDGKIRNFDHPDLKEHVQGAKGKEIENEMVRIVKGTTSNARKDDACVAQSMAVYKASVLDAEKKKHGHTFSVFAQGVVKSQGY